MAIHMRSHTGTINHIISPFSKKFHKLLFTTQSRFIQSFTVFAYSIFAGEKPYCCDKCPKRYHTSSNLSAHRKTHLGIRDHVCSTCGKAFGDSRTLKSHMRTHTGEKPYVCQVCGNRYTQSGQLAAHRKKIHHVQGGCNAP